MSIVTDGASFRKILGHYPTGVCAITATQQDQKPTAMIVGSFTSVSLDPPLVAFFPDKASTSWPKIEACGGFCVNVLADDQEALCRALASKDPEKFDGVPHRLSPRGAPILDGALAWIDCSLHAVHEAGDHYIAIGKVHALDIHHPGTPLLFHKGSYGKVAPLL
ncbi:flavin reductase domain protein FMN-binding protein [Sphingobium chlorophenolicum L-1]|uniref:Flavin reductase domain protein FMN-binding protein n=1 Tax=Sphingobium chlorophenolicum L-1 TaxID=690566 RepID=F6F2M3_SPHCR|nr:flavin reductase family protein [Sphingobium chlorophenolicum]AEG50685.1 flavin reductase domain protein FMN-binding protein [Sphingobium chlorophenolicum L-1]